VFADTGCLVRLYPIPLRYMDDAKYFKKYQWIEAYVTRSKKDPRPESYRIRVDDIQVFETIPTQRGNWDQRAPWILRPQNVFRSVEELVARQREDHTSLGLVKPAQVLDTKAERYPQAEREIFWERYQRTVAQMDLPLDVETGREVKPLTPPDYRFKIKFRCDDPACPGEHNFSVLDWELDALYFGQRQLDRGPDVAAGKVIEKLRQICASDKELYFYLGNIATHPQIFTIVGLWWPKRMEKGTKAPESRQQVLFQQS